MKSNNKLLHEIANNTGEEVEPVHSDNYYLKKIAENTEGGGGGGDVIVDSELSTTSKHPVQNKVITNALGDKVDKESGKGLFSGSYTDLTDKPTLPSKTSDLTNDGDGTNAFLTTHQDITGKADKDSFDTLDITITYTDDSTETKTFYVEPNHSLHLTILHGGDLPSTNGGIWNEEGTSTIKPLTIVSGENTFTIDDLPYGNYRLKYTQFSTPLVDKSFTYDANHTNIVIDLAE